MGRRCSTKQLTSGAAGAVLVARLFARMTRDNEAAPRLGVATLGVLGGMGLAALFEAV